MSVGWSVGLSLAGNAFVRWSTWRTLLAHLALFTVLAASKVGKMGGRQMDGSHLKQARLLMNKQVKSVLTG